LPGSQRSAPRRFAAGYHRTQRSLTAAVSPLGAIACYGWRHRHWNRPAVHGCGAAKHAGEDCPLSRARCGISTGPWRQFSQPERARQRCQADVLRCGLPDGGGGTAGWPHFPSPAELAAQATILSEAHVELLDAHDENEAQVTCGTERRRGGCVCSVTIAVMLMAGTPATTDHCCWHLWVLACRAVGVRPCVISSRIGLRQGAPAPTQRRLRDCRHSR
jgi:hypothetical protein